MADSAGRQRLRELCARFERRLLLYAASLTRDADAARDIVQDTFVRALEHGPENLDGQAAAWLFAVCRNRALDVRRKEKRMQAVDAQSLDVREARGTPIDEAAERGESAARMLRMIDELPANQREVVRLKFQADLSYRDIATVTGLSVTNVGYLLHMAMRELRHRLGEC